MATSSPTRRASSRSPRPRVAVIALLCCAALMLSMRRMRRAQQLVLGEDGQQDLVAHAAACRRRSKRCASTSTTSPCGSTGAWREWRAALRGTIAHRALVRYDAYNELSGHQSMSIALLDEEQSGIVLSCIHHRDQARVYAKQVTAGAANWSCRPRRPRRCAWRCPRRACRRPAEGDVEQPG